ncbi:MmyB family transcriptional regulator [Sandaracinobacteroides saxicola]|uniref:MmyB family transcriptional regulator n=1 Tax=Sandaracinobacteroides saxicola TaxID=2759707 RepID=UPI001FB10F01|nr:hypothetical protein [Sandaracinobacteroides saxicola]
MRGTADTAEAQITAAYGGIWRTSPLFATLWQENDVATTSDGRKRLDHPVAGPIELEFSSFAVEGRPELSMLVHVPVSPADAERVRSLVVGPA